MYRALGLIQESLNSPKQNSILQQLPKFLTFCMYNMKFRPLLFVI
jgi:hypothetical protein